MFFQSSYFSSVDIKSMKRFLLSSFLSIIFVSFIHSPSCLYGEVFEFKYKQGDTYRILTKVEEDVIMNGVYSHHAKIVNRVSIEVTGVNEDGSGVHNASFMASDESNSAKGKHFSWGNTYKSTYTRAKNGVFTISDELFMPVIRNLPIFPASDVKKGEKWTANGYEAEDLRRAFKMDKPYIVPFSAQYTYIGPQVQNDGRTLYEVRVSYNIYYDSPSPQGSLAKQDYPAQTMGHSEQTLFFDAEKGALDHYSEKFRIVIDTSWGNRYDFRGSSESVVQDFVRTADEKTVESVKDIVENLNIENVKVTAGENGLTISLENIKFYPDSDKLLESEMSKIEMIAEVVKRYPNNDLLITGHTARAGSVESQDKLSVERAEAVAELFIEMGVKEREHIFTKGMGSRSPVAPSDTEENKARNRRVEITILDK